MRFLISWAGVLAFLILSNTATASDWPRFRGLNGSATSEDTKVPTEWSDTKNLKWKLDLPGRGFSSPIVVGDRVFVTSYSREGGLKRHLVCVDRHKGKIVWSEAIAGTGGGRGRGGPGGGGGPVDHGYATNTPVSDGERVYVLFGTTGILAFDLKGKKLW